MTYRIFTPILTAIAVIASGLLTSCDHKDLCYCHLHKTKIRVVYDWQNAPEANPAGMCVFFYAIGSDSYYRFDFNNISGGEIEIPVGYYRLITYNNDTELVKFSATNTFDQHLAFTRNADLLEPLYGNGVSSSVKTDNGEMVKISPDGLWGCHTTDVLIKEHGVEYTVIRYDKSRAANDSISGDNGDQIITLYPHDMLCHYSYEVRNAQNAEHVSRISASLSGLSGTLKMSDESVDTATVTLPVPGQANATTKTITGQFLTFGQNASNAAPHKMTFYVIMDNGSKYVIKDAANLDVTTQVDNAPDQRHVHIIIDGLKFPDTGNPDEGWIPTVDDWGVKEEDLKI